MLDLNLLRHYHTQLTFDESHILAENIKGTTKKTFLSRLQRLYENTDDNTLKYSISYLSRKIIDLSPSEFLLLQKAASEEGILFPPNYTLPSELP